MNSGLGTDSVNGGLILLLPSRQGDYGRRFYSRYPRYPRYPRSRLDLLESSDIAEGVGRLKRGVMVRGTDVEDGAGGGVVGCL